MMRKLSRTMQAGAGVAAIAATLSACGATGDAGHRDAGARADRVDLGVVTLSARIGDDVVTSAGAVLDAERGLVLTTAHTLWGARSLKVTTGLAVLHGRIVARDACDDIALVELQPRLPGLVAVRPAPAQTGATAAGAPATVARRAPGASVATARRLVRVGVRAGGPEPGRPARVPMSQTAVALEGGVAAGASGAPVLNADDRLIGMSQVVAEPGRLAAVMVPWSTIAARMRELRPGSETVYVGWRRHYRCTPGLHAYARETHRGYRPEDARLTADVPVSRLPGSAVEGG